MALPIKKALRDNIPRFAAGFKNTGAVTRGIMNLVGLRVPTKGTAPTPPINPTLNRRNMGVITFAGSFGRHAGGSVNLVVPMMVAMCTSHSFAFVAGAPPTTILLGGTYNVSDNSNMPGGAGMTRVAHRRVAGVTRRGVPSLGTNSLSTTVDVVSNATEDVNVAMISWLFPNKEVVPVSRLAVRRS